MPSTIFETSFWKKRVPILIFQIEKLVPNNFLVIGVLRSKEELNPICEGSNPGFGDHDSNFEDCDPSSL